MNQPKVSAVITCYNYGHYLPFTLGSVLDQTYKNLEVIVINDGSTDNTDAIMQAYADIPTLRYVNQPNSGHAVAKNNGAALATGEFVAFLDGDDLWRRDKLEKQ